MAFSRTINIRPRKEEGRQQAFVFAGGKVFVFKSKRHMRREIQSFRESIDETLLMLGLLGYFKNSDGREDAKRITVTIDVDSDGSMVQRSEVTP